MTDSHRPSYDVLVRARECVADLPDSSLDAGEILVAATTFFPPLVHGLTDLIAAVRTGTPVPSSLLQELAGLLRGISAGPPPVTTFLAAHRESPVPAKGPG